MFFNIRKSEPFFYASNLCREKCSETNDVKQNHVDTFFFCSFVLSFMKTNLKKTRLLCFLIKEEFSCDLLLKNSADWPYKCERNDDINQQEKD